LVGRRWRVFVVSHTHWDREWYQAFQQFRMRLVELVEHLLDILGKDPGFRHFTLDGQTVAVEDFLEAEPDRRAELEGHVREGRILVGPWYVLPDEFLEGPEAMIRNLILGHRIAGGLGGVMRVGYIPDTFGHIGQMPQILRGFGIDSAVIWRGVGPDVDRTEFTWESPDGSRVLAVHLRNGYCYGASLPLEPDALRRRILRAVEELSPYVTTGNILLTNGCDHLEPQAGLPAALEAVAGELSGIELIHGTLPMYIDAVRAAGPELRTVVGDLRSHGRAPLLPSVLSARMWIKQRNARCERSLERWAEPLTAWSWLAEHPSPGDRTRVHRLASLCWLAWRYLIQNHPHDSICGCSIDQVHRDMAPRFDAVEEIAETVTREAAEAIARHVETDQLPREASAETHPLIVFNPVAGPRDDCVRARLECAERPGGLTVRDGSGEASPCQVLGVEEVEHYRMRLDRDRLRGLSRRLREGRLWRQVLRGGRTWVEDGMAHVEISVATRGRADLTAARRLFEEVRGLAERGDIRVFEVRAVTFLTDLVFLASGVPAHGYKTYMAEMQKGGREAASLPHGLSVIENEYYRVEVDPRQGTLSVLDKGSGRAFRGCNRLVDGGDAGDEYNYSPPHRDPLVSAPSSPPTITLVEDGPARSTVRVDMSYRLPAGLAGDRESRSPEAVEVPVTSSVSLYPGVGRVEIETTVDNRASDHRLRAVFPTGVKADVACAGAHFDVVERPVGAPEAPEGGREQPLGTYPQRGFVDVSDGEAGLMLASDGLPEYEALTGGNGVDLALTLLRCVGWLSRGDFQTRQNAAGPVIATPEAQCPGRHVFRYALMPHRGGWEAALCQAQWFNNPLRAFETDIHPGELPPEQSWLQVEPPSLVLSAVKMAEEGSGVIVRLYNVGEGAVEGRVRPWRPFSRARLVNLNEEALSEAAPDEDGWLNLRVGGKGIVSVRFDF